MKKALSLVLTFALVAMLLAACQGAAPASSVAPAPAPAASTATPAAEPTPGSESAAEAPAAEGVRVACIMSGPITDGDWNQSQYDGLMRIEAQGNEVNFVENMGETDSAQAARDFASAGYQLVYIGSNAFQDHCLPVAADFPDVTFVCINGTVSQDNFISVHIADEEQGFMMGVISALLTQSGQVGFVGGLEITPIKLGEAGFQQGIDYANENFELAVESKRIFTSSFTDVNKAKETAISLIEDGCDIVCPMASGAGVGVMEAVQEKGSMTVSSGLGLVNTAPDATQITVVKDVSVAFDATFAEFVAGTLQGTTEVKAYGVNQGVVYLTDWLVAPSTEVQERVADVMAKLTSGEIAIDISGI